MRHIKHALALPMVEKFVNTLVLIPMAKILSEHRSQPMTNLQHIAQELAEEFAPLVIGQSGTTKTFTAEQVSALYHIAVDFWTRNEEASVDVELPVGVVESLGEVS